MSARGPLRILMVTRETASERLYGLGKSLAPVVAALGERGHVVRYLSQEDLGQRSRRLREAWLRRRASIWQRWPAAGALGDWVWALLERINMGRLAARVAARDAYAIVHCHDPFIGLGFWLFRRLSAARRARWGISQHGFGSYAQALHEDGLAMSRLGMRWMRGLEASMLQAADWVMAPTSLALRALARDLALTRLPGHWHVVCHPKPGLRCHLRAHARRTLAWDDDVFYVLGVGRVVPLKQFDVLVRACASLNDPKRLKLVILGEGDRGALQELGRTLGLAHPIEFAVTDDVGLYLAAADAYVSTSATESFGMANLEALCAGLPSICSPVGGVPEVVGAGAWLVPPTVDAVKMALQRLREDRVLRDSWSRAAILHASAWPDASTVADQYESVYRQVLAG